MAVNRKLGRPTDQRLAILRNQTTDLILHNQIETTEARAKEVKSIVDMFDFEDDAEITIEANPNDVTENFLKRILLLL